MVIKHDTKEKPDDMPLEEWLWITGKYSRKSTPNDEESE